LTIVEPKQVKHIDNSWAETSEAHWQ